MTPQRRFTFPAVAAVLLGGVVGAGAASSTLLTAGAPLDRDLGPGRTASHSLEASAGLYVRITIEPHGVSPVVTLLDPEGAVVTQAQDADGRDAPLTVSFIAERGGVHTVRLTARAAQDVGARYRITLDPPRPPAEEDRARVRAERACSEAIELAAQGTAESRRAALQRYQEAREIRRRLGEAREEADLLSQIGSLQIVLGAPRDARVTLEESLAVSREGHYLRGEAEALNNLGSVSWSLGELGTALEQYDQALPIFSRLGLLRDQAITLNNIATVHKDRGDPRKALELYERALPLRRRAADLRGQAIGLNNIAVAHLMLGEDSPALAALEQAVPLARAAGDAGAELSVLQTLGALWVGNGELDRALETLGVALELSRRGGNRAGEAYALNKIGDVLRRKGDYAQALTMQLRALELRRALGDPIGESRALTSLAMVEHPRGEYAAAEEHLNTALRLQTEVGNRYLQTYTILEQGSLWDDLGQWSRAEEAYGQALALSRSIDDVWGEASTRFRMARLRRARGDLEEARKSAEAATLLLESIRAQVARQSRASFFVPAQEVYDFLIDLLMAMDAAQPDRGFAEQAFAASERKRARSLLDLLAESRADLFGGADPELRRQAASLRDRLTARTQEHVRLLGSRPTEERAAANAREIAELLAQYERLEGQLRADRPSYSALTEGAVAGSAEVRKLLDDRTVLLEFSLGEEASYAWAVTRDAVHTFRLAPRREITTAARALRDAITSSRPPHGLAPKDAGGWEAAGAELSRLLLRPLASQLDHDRVVIVPDGILHYVPFGALPDVTGTGGVFLERHEVVLLPSGSALAALRMAATPRPAKDKAVAILADPVFEADDPRIAPANRRRALPVKGPAWGEANGDTLRAARDVERGAETASFGRLLFSRREADAISAVAPPGSVLRALNFDASRALALSADLAHYRIVHFATHGFVNDRHPDLSGLVLSLVDRQGKAQDGFLRLRDVYALHLPVDLVVLSGCQTGLGEEIRGEGLVGLVRGFMYAGTPRVVASLWSVEDRATAALMSEFYRRLLGSSRPPAEALREAQLAIRAQPRWRHPFYWAGFTLQGDWQ